MKKPKLESKEKKGFFSRIFGIFRSNKKDDSEEFQEKINNLKLLEKAEQEEKAKRERKQFAEIDNTNSDIPRPLSKVSKAPIFVKDLDTKKYCEELYNYLQDNGLSVSMNNVREFFASIAASKLVIVKHENIALAERFIEVASEFIGATFYKDFVKSELGSFEDLLDDRYYFKEMITQANQYPNRIYISSFKNIQLEHLEEYYDTIFDYSWNPLMPCEISDGTDSFPETMPENTWFMVIPSDVNDSYMSFGLAKSAILLELHAKLVDPQEEVIENEKKLTYEFLSNLLFEGYDQYYIEEKEWKKIDRVEAYLNENSTFTLDNRLFRQLERYTSTFLLFGGDKNEAMDIVLYSKLLRAISVHQLHKDKDGENGLFHIFEKEFGLENLMRSKSILKEFQKKSEPKVTIEDVLTEDTTEPEIEETKQTTEVGDDNDGGNS